MAYCGKVSSFLPACPSLWDLVCNSSRAAIHLVKYRIVPYLKMKWTICPIFSYCVKLSRNTFSSCWDWTTRKPCKRPISWYVFCEHLITHITSCATLPSIPWYVRGVFTDFSDSDFFLMFVLVKYKQNFINLCLPDETKWLNYFMWTEASSISISLSKNGIHQAN